jgi:hypothetical protein
MQFIRKRHVATLLAGFAVLGVSFVLCCLGPKPTTWAGMQLELYTQCIGYGIALTGILIICAALAGLVGQAIARAWEKYTLKHHNKGRRLTTRSGSAE